MIYVVLGMHKSGTTLVSQILHHSGINMDDELDESVSYDGGNKYERQSILHLNMEILGLEDYQVIDFRSPTMPSATADQQRQMERIVADCTARYEEWGFKDPRTCLTYPLWAEALPEHRIIIVYREPSQLRKRFVSPHPLRSYRVPRQTWLYLNRWYEHNMNIIKYLQSTKCDYIVMSYNELMTGDREFDRLQHFVGRDLADRRLKDLYRGRGIRSHLFMTVDWLLKRRRGHNADEVMNMLNRLRD